MRKLGLMLMLLVGSLMMNAQQEALNYMSKIDVQYEQLNKDMWDYMKKVAHSKSARKIEKSRQTLIQTTYSAKAKVKSMRPLDGSTAYKDSVYSFLDMSYHVLKEDYAKIMDMEEIAEQSYDLMEAYILAKKTASAKMEAASATLQQAQKDFCEKNGITLLEGTDEGGEKMRIAGEVFDIYNEYYLVFFKSFVQETSFLVAMSTGDVNGMEQAKSSLVMYVEECKKEAQDLDTYKGDGSLKVALRKMLDFYAKEVESMDEMINFFVVKEKFDKIQKELEKTPKNRRTQKQIDEYNEYAGKMNEVANKFNQLNEKFNNERSKLLDAWNKTSAKFTDTHVPS